MKKKEKKKKKPYPTYPTFSPSHTHMPPSLPLTYSSLIQSTFAASLHTSTSTATPHVGLFFSHGIILLFSFSVFDIYHESTIWFVEASSSAIFHSNFFVSHCIFQHLKWAHFTFLSFLASFSN